ncbi:MAG TPA: YCF48-related protein [Polyangiaceae bacterium]
MRNTIGLFAAFVLLAACSSSSSGNNADAGGGGGGGGDDGGTPTNEGGTTNPDGGGGGTFAWHAITLPDDLDATDNAGERVTGVVCTAVDKCIVTTNPFGEAGHVYATDGKVLLNGNAPLITGDGTYADQFHTAGSVEFLGAEIVGTRVILRLEGAENAFVSATGDITAPASWTSTTLGTSGTADTNFGLNAQFGIGTNGTKWAFIGNGRVWEATTATPAPATSWMDIFSPNATPPIPSDIDTQRTADPTLCNTDPSVSFQPTPDQNLYFAPDLSLIVTPASAVNQFGDDTAGVCISLDGGHTFHHSAFAGLNDGQGPTGINCSSKDHCVAYGGTQSNDGSAVVYMTNNASAGKDSTWAKATIPTTPNDSGFRDVAFAPDGMHGWLVGSSSSNGSLMYTTTDGGATWTDSTADVKTLAKDNRLHSVYVYDATHVYIGGEQGVLLASGS